MSRPTGYPDYNDRLDFWSLHSNYPQALKEQTALPRRPGLLTGKKNLLTCRNRHLPRDLGAAPTVTGGVHNGLGRGAGAPGAHAHVSVPVMVNVVSLRLFISRQ